MVVVELACLAVFLYLCFVYLKPKPEGKLPDGPRGIPIFGNALQINKETALLDISDIGKNYGDAFTINLFREPIVVLNSYDMIMEAFNSPKYAVAFGGRPDNFVSRHIIPQDEVFTTYSEEWSALRKLVFKGLKTYGSNMAEVEDLVQQEIKYFLERLNKEAGKCVDPYHYITGYVSSVISMLITGRHLKQEHEQLTLLATFARQVEIVLDPTTLQLFDLVPALRFVPIGIGKLYQDLQANIAEIKKKINEDRMKPREESGRKPCFLDFMYEEKEKGNVTQQNIDGVMLDLLLAGTATTRSTLYSMFLILTAKPEIQKRIQEEIDEVVGSDRLPCFTDKNSMPYTQAVLWETVRLYPAVPVPIARYTTQDVHIRDYLIPKNTQVYHNVWLINHDEKFWKDPYVFNPDRFLDETGNLIPPEDEKRYRTLTFSTGKRLCIGETLARIRMFLALVSVLQNFNLFPDPSHPLPDTDPRTFIADGILLSRPYNIVFKPRNGN